MPAETHKVKISTAPAVSEPSIRERTESVEPPTFQRIWSICSSSRGSKPLTHKTMAIQATQEMLRSKTRTAGVSPKATCNTLAPTRMHSSATSAGSAIRNTTRGIHAARRACAP